MGAAPSTGDLIFWSGAYKRLIVGNEKGEFVPGECGVQGRVPKSQKSTTDPVRIVVSDSHDLAYEYSKGTLQLETKEGKHQNIERGILRVWQKVAGEWKEAAVFARPYD
jgi:hypothetical protein